MNKIIAKYFRKLKYTDSTRESQMEALSNRHRELSSQIVTGLLSNPGGPIQYRNDTGWGWTNTDAQGFAEFVSGLADTMLDQEIRAGVWNHIFQTEE